MSSGAESLYALPHRIDDPGGSPRAWRRSSASPRRRSPRRLDSAKRFVFVKRRLPPAVGAGGARAQASPRSDSSRRACGSIRTASWPPTWWASRARTARAWAASSRRGTRTWPGRRAGPSSERDALGPRGHRRARRAQGARARAGRHAHARRHHPVHRGEGDRRGVAPHARRRPPWRWPWTRAPARSSPWPSGPPSTRTRFAVGHRRRAAQPRGDRSLRAGLDLQGDHGRGRPRGGRGAARRPHLRRERRDHDRAAPPSTTGRSTAGSPSPRCSQNSSNVGSIKVGLSLGKRALLPAT